MNGDQLHEQLRLSRAALLRAAEGISDALIRRRLAADEWSAIEVLAHLIDVDYHWLGEASAIQHDPGHLFVHFDDARWKAEHPDARRSSLASIMDALDRSHRTVLSTLARMSAADLDRTGKHPRGIPYAARDVFLRYPAHDRNHTEQIVAIRGRLGE